MPETKVKPWNTDLWTDNLTTLSDVPVTVQGQDIYVSSIGCFYTGIIGSQITADGNVYVTASGGLWANSRYIKSGILPATAFGVNGNGVDCGSACESAVNFIMRNGGVLEFPSGEVNWGTTRPLFVYPNGPEFSIAGSESDKTVFTFDDVEPRSGGVSWGYSETPLLRFGEEPNTSGSNYLSKMTIRDLHIDYSRQVNKGGPTKETMGAGAHPTPYSDGALGIQVMGADRVTFERVDFSNIYGSALRLWKCSDAIIDRVFIYNCSANQPLSPTGSEAADHFGYGIWSGACMNTVIKHSHAWNPRVYECDPTLVSPTNGVAYNGTLCGYIGFYAEYAMNQNNASRFPKRAGAFLNGSNGVTDPTHHVHIHDCVVYGYTLGIKSEAATEILVNNNRVTNCYIPISCQSSGRFLHNYVQFGEADGKINPQNGMEGQRGVFAFTWFASTTRVHRQEAIGNIVICNSSRAFSIGKAHVFIQNNYIYCGKSARFFDTAANFDIDLVDISNNFLRTSEDLVSNDTGHIRLTGVRKLNFHNNTVYNVSDSVPIRFQIYGSCRDTKVFDNVFRNGIYIYSSMNNFTLDRNSFHSIENDLQPLECYLINCNNQTISNNDILIYNRQKVESGQFVMATNINGLIVDNNRVQVVTGSSNAGVMSLVKTFSVSYNVEITRNRVYGDSASGEFGIRLADVASGVHMFKCDGNSTDSTTAMLRIFSIGAPWDIGNNQWSFNFSSNVNTPSNVSSSYIPSYGDRMYSTYPASGGIEGYVYTTASQWVGFGTIQ